ncbi:MAG: MotA/TolQ/ExbB proton channel family protein [Bacteroidales bacterium]|jgi:biopolymer transport protein ExbB/TolQ|nr:MotA/TolQ/ExbB proton channel family protein [Bacteroidales bacterium]
MEFISKSLFWVANSLLIPDIILLLVLFGRALLLAGSFYSQLMIKRREDRRFSSKIKNLSFREIAELRDLLPEKDDSLFIKYLREFLGDKTISKQGDTPLTEAYAEYLLCCLENEVDKELSLSKLLAKTGPVLGLIGTLIAMSPALVGLSTGDISGMAYNMQVVFATTVVGLVVSLIGLVTLQFKQRWYAKDLYNLEYVSRILIAPQS